MTPANPIRRDLPRHPTVWPRQAGAPMFPFEGKDVRLMISNGTLRVAPGHAGRRVTWSELLTVVAILFIIGVMIGLAAIGLLSCNEEPAHASSIHGRSCQPVTGHAGDTGLQHL